jgi:hypothetical protein
VRALLLLVVFMSGCSSCRNVEGVAEARRGLFGRAHGFFADMVVTGDMASSPPDLTGISPTALCTGYTLNSRANVSYSNLAKPALGVRVADPNFAGTNIVRVTDVVGAWGATANAGAAAVPVYPTIQAWNSDETLMFVYLTGDSGPHGGDHALLNGKPPYNFVKWLTQSPPDLEQFFWSTTDPDIIYYMQTPEKGYSKNQLVRLHVGSFAEDVIHDFTADRPAPCAGTTSISGGQDPYAMSLNSDLIGLGCYLGHNGPNGARAFQAFSYRISSNTIGANFLTESVVPQALPSAAAMYWEGDGTAVEVRNSVTNAVIRSLPFKGDDHADLLRNLAGDDIVIAAQFDGPSGSGNMMWVNLTQGGAVHTIIGEATGDGYPRTGTLMSGRAYNAPGWVTMGVTGDIKGTSTFIDQEVFVANVDSGDFCRVAHHRSTGDWANAANSNYWAQPNVSFSPSGTRILIPSDWGAATPGAGVVANPNATTDTYVIELSTFVP